MDRRPSPTRLKQRARRPPPSDAAVAPVIADGLCDRWGPYELRSHFQPVFSLSHMRLVGHEALLRARDAEAQAVSPESVFRSCPDPSALAECDLQCSVVHLGNFGAQRRQGEWLFLNVHPHALGRMLRQEKVAAGGDVLDACRRAGVPNDALVLEILETEIGPGDRVGESVAFAQSQGILTAIDDFGAGHSNFDRIWNIRPDIVKLDRSLVTRAVRDPRAQRVVSQMVSLLHECGAMVLMEGVETRDEALLALDCDADMVQGYYFGRPQAALMPARHSPLALRKLYEGQLHQHRERTTRHRERVAPILQTIERVGGLLAAGQSVARACGDFLELPGAEVCYVLDAQGYQIESNLWTDRPRPGSHPVFAPMLAAEGACWSRRHYFRRAIDHPERAHVSRPYRTIFSRHQCVTASFAYPVKVRGQIELRVVCGDVRWEDFVAAQSEGSDRTTCALRGT